MKKYKVTVTFDVLVVADNEKEAENKAFDIIYDYSGVIPDVIPKVEVVKVEDTADG